MVLAYALEQFLGFSLYIAAFNASLTDVNLAYALEQFLGFGLYLAALNASLTDGSSPPVNHEYQWASTIAFANRFV